MNSKIIDKIQNLLELAYDAPNDEEGQTALLMAQRLMVKHNLSMNDLTNSKTQKDIGETIGTWEYRLPWWQEKLAGILGENFRCKTIRRRLPEDGITQIIFFGYQSDAELCSKVYEGALLYLKYRLKRLFPIVSRARWKDYKKSYLLGFLNGVDQRFQEQVQSSEEFEFDGKNPSRLLGFLLIIVIDTVVLLIISVLGSGALSLWIMARYSYELFGKELQDKKEKRVANLPDSKKESVNFLRYSLMILLAMILVVALLYIFNAELLFEIIKSHN